jgi:ribosomal protein S18 acetylase RimI-like enzyme
VYGWVFGGAAEIALLWVREDQRGAGLGSRLLLGSEEHARAAGCAQMVIRTHSFQPPGFYRAHGYQDVASIADYPREHAFHLLRKDL